MMRAQTQAPEPAPPTAVFVFPLRVYYEDTDAGGVVYYANYLKFMERARTEWLRELGFEQARMAQEHGVMFVVRALAAQYLKPARLDDLLQVEAAVAELKRSQLVFSQSVKRAHATLVSATVNIACVGAVSFKPVAIPHALREKFSVIGRT